MRFIFVFNSIEDISPSNHCLKKNKKKTFLVYTAQCNRYVCIDRKFSRLLGFSRKIIVLLFFTGQKYTICNGILQTIATILSLTSVQNHPKHTILE